MREISASKFKEQCFALLNNLDNDGIVVTKRGKPVARVMPIRSESSRLIGSMKGKIEIRGDIMSTGVKWGC